VRVGALDGATCACRYAHAYEQLKFTASVAIVLQVHHQQPVVRDQAKRPAFSAFAAQIVAGIITGIDASD
jgi:hypothetical protein